MVGYLIYPHELILMEMNFLALPVDLRHQILLLLPLNEIWRLTHHPDPGIRITFFCRTGRYFSLRLKSPLRDLDPDPFQSYLLNLIQNHSAHREMDLFHPDSPILLLALGPLIGYDQLALRALRFRNRSLVYQILSLPLTDQIRTTIISHDPSLVSSSEYSISQRQQRQKKWNSLIYMIGIYATSDLPENREIYNDGLNGKFRPQCEHGLYLLGLIDGHHEDLLIRILPHVSCSVHDLIPHLVREKMVRALRVIPHLDRGHTVLAAVQYNQVEISREYFSADFLIVSQGMLLSREMLFFLREYQIDVPPFRRWLGAVKYRQMDFFLQELTEPIPEDVNSYALAIEVFLQAPSYYLQIYLQRYSLSRLLTDLFLKDLPITSPHHSLLVK